MSDIYQLVHQLAMLKMLVQSMAVLWFMVPDTVDDTFVGSENDASYYVAMNIKHTITTAFSRSQSLSNFYSSQYQS